MSLLQNFQAHEIDLIWFFTESDYINRTQNLKEKWIGLYASAFAFKFTHKMVCFWVVHIMEEQNVIYILQYETDMKQMDGDGS